MTGVTGVLIKIGVRLVVFGLVFFIAAKRHPKVKITNKWATPLIALVFALLNTVLYWALSPILNVASMGALEIAMPFALNLIFLLITIRIFQSKKWLEVEGFKATALITLLLGLAHCALWFGLDYLPPRF
jgi:hypothetical protein